MFDRELKRWDEERQVGAKDCIAGGESCIGGNRGRMAHMQLLGIKCPAVSSLPPAATTLQAPLLALIHIITDTPRRHGGSARQSSWMNWQSCAQR